MTKPSEKSIRVADEDKIVFGLKEYMDPEEITVAKQLLLPFRKNTRR